MEAIFFTGYPGFLASELLPRVLSHRPESAAVCMVQPRFAALARERAAALGATRPELRERIEIVEGDITRPGLGLSAAGALHERVVEVHHLAAVYDLSVGRELAMRVNVEGTRNVLAFARACPRLRHLHYVSTCYVSGRHRGVFTEEMLSEGQAFNNFYEETKYLAEVEVREAMDAGLPATVYRPSVVTGDSTTGATQKYDGPYFVMQWLLRQPRVAFLPVVGDPRATVFNMVPRDFVVDAIAHLSARPDSAGRVFHLADPEPLKVAELLDEMARATGRRVVRVPLPLAVAKGAIDRVPGVHRLMRIPSSAVDYFVHPTRYDTSQAEAALAGSGVRCPRVPEYLERLVAFMRAHPGVGAAAMA
jgi:thioester reductase-like protein